MGCSKSYKAQLAYSEKLTTRDSNDILLYGSP